MLRSDTLLQHQSDPRHRSNLIPTGRQNDDTNRVDFAARTAWVDVTGASWTGFFAIGAGWLCRHGGGSTGPLRLGG